MACTTLTRGEGSGAVSMESTVPSKESLPEVAVMVRVRRVPVPSISSRRSPSPMRLTVTAWRASGPEKLKASPVRAAERSGWMKTGRDISGGTYRGCG